jgi:hypothetical protein
MTTKPKIFHLLTGGLGNQLFQIFATIATAYENKIDFFFMFKKDTPINNNNDTFRPAYWENFLIELKPYVTYDSSLKKPINFIEINENNHSYDKIILNSSFLIVTPENVNNIYSLKGYRQSYKYFHKYFNEIMEVTGIEKMKNQIKTEVLSRGSLDFNKTVSMHFRMGDYKKLPEYHPILPKTYYINSLAYILQNDWSMKKVLYFCEEEDIKTVEEDIINQMKEIFTEVEFIRCDEKEDWKQMLIMSLCNHNIIANSTFSWWGAYLNSNIDKIVCYPSIWFGTALLHTHNVADMFPPTNWVKM